MKIIGLRYDHSISIPNTDSSNFDIYEYTLLKKINNN